MESASDLEPNHPGRLRRWLVLVGAMALASSTAFLTWWHTTLSGLPDIGDPFDVAAFIAAESVPDDENAFVLYRQAADRLTVEPSNMNYDWPLASPIEKGWLDRNREAYDLWRKGTERSGSLYYAPQSVTIMTMLPVVQKLRDLSRLAQLEGGRLEAAGDFEGAWRAYRAIFRSSRHVGHRGVVIERLVGVALHQVACRKLTGWGNDPRVPAPLIRQALDAAISDYATTRPISDNYKVEYLSLLKSYDDSEMIRTCLNDANQQWTGTPWFARAPSAFGLIKTFKKEPERSRRVTRLIFANILATCDLRSGQRPPIAHSIADPNSATPARSFIDLYAVTPTTGGPDRMLPPAKIDEWFRSTLYAYHLMSGTHVYKAVDRERAAQTSLILSLASRLYEIDHGKRPETNEILVGPYLKALPDDDSSPK